MTAKWDTSLLDGNAYSFSISPADYGVIWHESQIQFCLERIDHGTFALRAGELTLLLRGTCASVSIMFDWLVDVLLSKLLMSCRSGVMLLRSAGWERVILTEICPQDRD